MSNTSKTNPLVTLSGVLSGELFDQIEEMSDPEGIVTAYLELGLLERRVKETRRALLETVRQLCEHQGVPRLHVAGHTLGISSATQLDEERFASAQLERPELRQLVEDAAHARNRAQMLDRILRAEQRKYEAKVPMTGRPYIRAGKDEDEDKTPGE